MGIVKALAHDDSGAQWGALLGVALLGRGLLGGGLLGGPRQVEYAAEVWVVHVFVLLVGMLILVKVECQALSRFVYLLGCDDDHVEMDVVCVVCVDETCVSYTVPAPTTLHQCSCCCGMDE